MRYVAETERLSAEQMEELQLAVLYVTGKGEQAPERHCKYWDSAR